LTTLNPLPAEDLKLNPNVPHPPFPWRIGIPSDWALLDTHPQTWERSARRLVDDRFHGRKLSAAERRAVLGFLEQLVADCQRSGAALSMIQLGRLSSGAVGSAGLHVAWYNSAPDLAGLAPVRQILPRSGTVTEIETPNGTGLLHADAISTVPPGARERVRSMVFQLFLPLAGTTWTMVFSSATPHPEMEPVLNQLMIAMAQSVELDPSARVAPSPSPRPASPNGSSSNKGSSNGGYRAAPRPNGPGIEKGFGTMLPESRPDSSAEDDDRA